MLIRLSQSNIADEHICCGFSDKKCAEGYEAKKKWLASQFDNGYTFKKEDVRGKVFIEYVSAEQSWLPIDAPGYLYISCFWVSGQFAGKQLGQKLMDECFEDNRNKNGVVVITSDKKRPFMNDGKFFRKQGFNLADTAAPYFELWYKPNNPDVPVPKFYESAKTAECENKNGIVVYYSNACVFTEYYNNTVMKNFAGSRGIPLEIIKLNSREDGKKMPVPWIINSVFYNGKFITSAIITENDLVKLIC